MAKREQAKVSDSVTRGRVQGRRFRRALWEMWLVLGTWAAAGLYAVPVCFWLGYRRPPETITYPLGLGIPDWVFWGILAPWLVCNLITIIVCFAVMEDVPLEQLEPLRRPGHHAANTAPAAVAKPPEPQE